MIIVQTPLRVSLFGGGTDFPPYYLSEGGCVLTTVSYTHLRAHETPEPLVCRLLLKKKKKTNTTTNLLYSS